MSTTATERDQHATRSFLQPDETTIDGLTFRPVSMGSLALLKATRNEFLVPAGPEQPNPLTGLPERTIGNDMLATLAFAYIHGAPQEEVRRYAWNETVFREKVLEWGERIHAETMPRLFALITRTLESIQALEFAVQPKKQAVGEKENEPPN